jgi:tetratricopeptide (TPR) repeat protein
MNEPLVGQTLTVDALVGQIADEFTQRLNQGEQPEIEDYAQRYPDIAGTLREVLAALLFVRVASPDLGMAPSPPASALRCLGDYRILREVGRGGMGVVYEAEQLSLARRVALKVLPFAATLDGKQLQRFKNESHAAANLHHPNIVPVYAVGCERGVHFYAMQFIEGQTLAALIQQQRRLAGLEVQEAPAPTHPLEAANPASADCGSTSLSPLPMGATPQPDIPTTEDARGPAFFQTVARLGIQAAQGLEHAHQMGVLHRDIKPANLLVDRHGHLWITDFGLARLHGESALTLTLTGDVVGTLRYMSPEQALSQRVLLDHRTDIYSLGVTLYELLTLRPAVDGVDREEVMRRITSEEPAPPRRFHRGIPAELETIVLKAMAKNPAERFATAQELADDLQRFLEDRPIQARRPTPLQRLRKWARRNRAAVWAAGTLLLALLLVAAGNWLWLAQKRGETEAAVQELLQRAAQWQAQKRWPESLEAAQRARALLQLGGGSADLRQRVERLVVDLEMVRRLEEVRLEQAAVRDDAFDRALGDALYAKAFRDYGLEVEALDVAEAAARVRGCSICLELAAALDDWAQTRQWARKGAAGWKHLVAVARAADPNPWRNRLRDVFERSPLDKKRLVELAASAEIPSLPVPTLLLLGNLLRDAGAVDQAVAVLRKAQQQHPGDFWINTQLAECYASMRPPQKDEALRFNTAALTLRSQNPGAHLNVGVRLAAKGLWEEAITEYQLAIRLKPDYPMAYYNLGGALWAGKKGDEAIAAYREAIRLKPDYPLAHYNLGNVLMAGKKWDQALTAYREAIRLEPGFALAHYGLGLVLGKEKRDYEGAIKAFKDAIRLRKKPYPEAYANLGFALAECGKLDEAIAAYQKAIAFKPDHALTHFNLGNALMAGKRWDEAIAAYREAIRLDPDHADAHYNLGNALKAKGKWDEVIAEYREAIRLKPDHADAHYNLGIALCTGKRDYEGGIKVLQAALRLKPDHADAHYNLGNALVTREKWDEALAAFREAVRLKPDLVDAHCNLGNVLLRKGKWKEAVAAYQEAIRVKPDHALAHYNLGLTLAERGKWERAIEAYQETIRLMPDHPVAYHSLAWLLATCPQAKLRDPPRAVELAGKAVHLAPAEGMFWTTLGVARYRAGDWKAAAAALEKSVTLRKGGTPLDWFFLAMAHGCLEDKKQADRWYQKAVTWMDQNKEALEKFPAFRQELVRLRSEAEAVLEESAKH